MNEDQPHNCHKLHIEPCPCGNLSPTVMGDDFDADVCCGMCGRITPDCCGTKGAIAYWNANAKILQPDKPDTLDPLKTAVANLRKLNAEHDEASKAWNAVPFTWHETPEKTAALNRVNAAAGAVMRAEARIIKMLLEQPE